MFISLKKSGIFASWSQLAVPVWNAKGEGPPSPVLISGLWSGQQCITNLFLF